MTKLIEEEKPLAVLYGSEKEFGLMNMSSPLSRQYAPAAAPTAYVERENYLQMWRFMDQGAVEVEVNIGGKLSGKPMDVYNTVAEIRGSEKPDEVVIIGGHLDSWDLGTGATDNGAGAMAVLAAARALQKLGVQPKRTIRFVMFTGEEQGLNGSRAYVKAHAAELPKISAMLVLDIGTGKVLTVDMMGNYAARETMDHVLYPLAAAPTVGLSEPSHAHGRRIGSRSVRRSGRAGIFLRAGHRRLRQDAPFAGGHARSRALGRSDRGRASDGGVCVQRGAASGFVAAQAGEACGVATEMTD